MQNRTCFLITFPDLTNISHEADTAGQGQPLTSRLDKTKRTGDWTSRPATAEEPCYFGYFHDLSRSLLGCWRRPRSQLRAGQGSHLISGHYGASLAEDRRPYQPQQRILVVFDYSILRPFRVTLVAGCWRASEITATSGSNLAYYSGHYGSKQAEDWASLPAI
jgi:hypothetical protein